MKGGVTVEPDYSKIVLLSGELLTLRRLGRGRNIDVSDENLLALENLGLASRTCNEADENGTPIFSGSIITKFGKRYLLYHDETFKDARSTRIKANVGVATGIIALVIELARIFQSP